MALRICQHEIKNVCELLVWLSTGLRHSAEFGFQAIKEDARRLAAEQAAAKQGEV